jgi:hypothetical protein
MNPDFTQQQSLNGLQRSEQLSLQATAPPAEVPGYKVEYLLGQGAFGQVWKGRDLNTERQVAIKFYLHSRGVDWSVLRREVKHLVSMSTGRYIVQVLFVGWDAEPPYYVMEFLERGSLEDQIRARGTLGVTETVAILREIAEGLSYAHSKGVLHCDLKPANVLLDHGWRPRLADFGQSRMSDDQTPSLGTLFFMAPEQADLKAVPHIAWDVYALGAIAYSMLVGSPPYRTSEAVEQFNSASSLPERLKHYQAVLRSAPRPRLHYRRRGIDKPLCQIIDRCLAVPAEQRYSSVQQVIAAIDARNHLRARRPLVVMGVVGPLLLLLLLVLFSARSISLAKQESLNRVQQLSLRGNEQTARFAKLTMESEIRSLYQLVEREAGRRELAQRIRAVEEASRELLDSLADGQPHPELRDRFLQIPERQTLDAYLNSRIEFLLANEGNGAGVAIFNSLFVTESRGTNIGIAFSNAEEELADRPVGRNFAFRSYFNGGREDGDKTQPPHHFSPTRQPHLSASFRSTSTGKWKMGISAPIWPQSMGDSDVDEGAQGQPIGVLVLTVNLGDFVLLSDVAAVDAEQRTNSDATQSPASKDTQFTVLVDGRSGNQRGTLLQHPLIAGMDRPTMLKSTMPQMDERQLDRLQSSGGIVDYLDPAANFPDGEEDFSGKWIAAIAQVHLPLPVTNPPVASQPSVAAEAAVASQAPASAQVGRPKSDLWVLVQERSSAVDAPVKELGNRLQRESYIALGTLLLLILVLWFFVLKIGRGMFRRSAEPEWSNDSSLVQTAAQSAYEPTIDSNQ